MSDSLWEQAIAEVEAHYPEDVFPSLGDVELRSVVDLLPPRLQDRFAAECCRLACRNVRLAHEELLANAEEGG